MGWKTRWLSQTARRLNQFSLHSLVLFRALHASWNCNVFFLSFFFFSLPCTPSFPLSLPLHLPFSVSILSNSRLSRTKKSREEGGQNGKKRKSLCLIHGETRLSSNSLCCKQVRKIESWWLNSFSILIFTFVNHLICACLRWCLNRYYQRELDSVTVW